MNCFFCQIPVPDDAKLCSACGRDLGKVCPSCKLLYERGANFCMSCGGKLTDRSGGDRAVKKAAPQKTAPLPKEKKNAQSLDRGHITLTEIIAPESEPPSPAANGGGVEIDLNTLAGTDFSIEIAPQGKEPAVAVEEEALPVEEEKNDAAGDIAPQASEVTIRESRQELNPYLSDTTYAISLQELSDAVAVKVTDPAIPALFDAMSRALATSKGGFFTIEAPAGSGKGQFTAAVEQFSQQNALNDVNIVISTVNPFDFDYTMFTHLVRSVLNLRTTDPQQVRGKLDKYFAGTLPEGKRESLTALLCLNFAPVQMKLPKNDLEYLLAFMCYWAARNKPVLWIVDNAGQINLRSLRFFKNLRRVFAYIPITVLFVCDRSAQITELVRDENRFRFGGVPHSERLATVRDFLKTPRLPADIEKVLNKPEHNVLYTQELLRLLIELGFIFDMRGSWRFQKIPDDLKIPDTLDELVLMRYTRLEPAVAQMLRRLVMLSLYQLPGPFLRLLFEDGGPLLDTLVAKQYLTVDGDVYRFTSRAMVHILKKTFKLEADDRKFYRDVVLKLSTAPDMAGINRHWLLLSYLNLGGITERKYNSFLYSSAVYMEKLGFFELAQRCYQSILSSFGKNQDYKNFRLYLELKNAKLWGFSDPQWARLFWQTMFDTAKIEGLLHIQLVAQGELFLLETDKIVIQDVVDVVKQLHRAGCYEDEISIIDRMTDLLLRTDNIQDAKIFAMRAFRIMEDIRSRDQQEVTDLDNDPATIIFIRAACKLAEVHIAGREYNDAIAVLEGALELAMSYNISYFKAKVMLLLSRIKFASGEDWESLIEEGFLQATQGMDFPIMKSYFLFFEEQRLESRDWLRPYLEYKNWINF